MSENTKKTVSHKAIVDMALIAMFAVVIAACSWISIPMTVPFTLQTFGIFCALGMLGGRRGTLSVVIYILLGMVGVPVFAGFTSGIGAILGTSGGYIIGFVFSALVYWLITKLLGNKLWVVILAMVIGLIVCYAFGTVWFMEVYARKTGAIGVATALGWCVFPFIIPDLLKISLAVFISNRVKKHVKALN